MNQYGLSSREEQVAGLLVEGKSNKQIAQALDIAERTVEYHLKNIYEKLNVGSRVEAILKLRETTGIPLGDSTVEEGGNLTIIESNKSPLVPRDKDVPNVTRRISLQEIIRLLFTYQVPMFMWLLLIIVIVVVLWFVGQVPWKYEREAEYPDVYTVGQVIQRSNASDEMVHGQFGTVPAWPAQPGYVIYQNINTPKTDHLILKLRYSKYSSSSVRILVYIDDVQRALIPPVDQGDWNKFVWTDEINLGKVEKGIHTLKFYTDGQEYGVADLDKFILTAGAP